MVLKKIPSKIFIYSLLVIFICHSHKMQNQESSPKFTDYYILLLQHNIKSHLKVTVWLNSITTELYKSQNPPSVSSILSHSSRMKCLTFFMLKFLALLRARIRPGVPTTMWGQLVFRTCSSFLMGMPPKNTAILTLFMYLLKRSYSLLIWKASSRVWHRTMTDT